LGFLKTKNLKNLKTFLFSIFLIGTLLLGEIRNCGLQY
jgi:hypothetical protein